MFAQGSSGSAPTQAACVISLAIRRSFPWDVLATLIDLLLVVDELDDRLLARWLFEQDQGEARASE